MSGVTDEVENANELQFGDINFNEVKSLTNDEMYFLLTKRKNAGVTNEYVKCIFFLHCLIYKNVNAYIYSLFEQTFAYVERVATTKIHNDIETLTMELSE